MADKKKMETLIKSHIDAVSELDKELEHLSQLKVCEWKEADIITKRMVELSKRARKTYKEFLINVEGGNKLKQWIRYTFRK